MSSDSQTGSDADAPSDYPVGVKLGSTRTVVQTPDDLERLQSKSHTINNEYYVAPIYNELIAAGKTVYASECETVWSLGTPDELDYFEANFEHDT